jgi:hypothetical protein
VRSQERYHQPVETATVIATTRYRAESTCEIVGCCAVMNKPRIIYTPRSAPSEAELYALAAVYKLVLFGSQTRKGGPHDLANKATIETRDTKQDKEGHDNDVCC